MAIILAAGKSSRMNTQLPKVLHEVRIGPRCRIGPFAHLREGTVLEEDVVLGVFTEIKNATLAEGVRARHHSYIGDAVIGRNVNVGAGSLTANYDGRDIHRTVVGDDCHIGSGAILVAPLVLKDGLNVGPGTIISNNNHDRLGHNGNSGSGASG